MDTERKLSDPHIKWRLCIEKVAMQQDVTAFKELYTYFGPLIKAFAYKTSSFNQAEQLAEVLVQESMIKIWSKAASFNPEKASASTWIFTIVRNTRIDLLRKNSRTVKEIEQEEDFDIDDIWVENINEDPFNQISQQRLKASIHESIDELPLEQSFMIKKVYLESKSHEEVSKELDIPLGTVKSRVRLGLKKLKFSVDREVS